MQEYSPGEKPSNQPDPEHDIINLGEFLSGLPARDFDAIMDDPCLPFARPEESQQRIKNTIDAEMKRKDLSAFEVYEMVQNALPTLPSVYQEDIDFFTPEICMEWLETGLPVDDSIYISAFERALGIVLVDL